MAKRHPALVSLSHDHHHGLALALRLRQGAAALLTDGWTHDRAEQARRVARFFDEELDAHFAAEEEVIFPATTPLGPGAEALARLLREDHRELRSLVGDLMSVQGEERDDVLVSFGEILDAHIRREERELFPLLERELADTVLSRLGDGVEEVRVRYRGRRRLPVHVDVSRVINAPTPDIAGAIQAIGSYGSWWPEGVTFLATGPAGEAAGGGEVILQSGAFHVTLRLAEEHEGRFLEYQSVDPGSPGTMRWSITDFRGGRKVRWEVNLDPSSVDCGPIAARLSAAAEEALASLESLLIAAGTRRP